MALDWDASYTGERLALWDTGKPQQAFYDLAVAGRLQGRVLDVGCGTGEHAMMAAAWGLDAVGLDISAAAVGLAAGRAAARRLPVAFEQWDALALAGSGAQFRTVLDCGLFHCFTDAQQARYVEGLAAVTEPGGFCHLMCYSDYEPGRWGPRRVSRDLLYYAFRDGWAVRSIEPRVLMINGGSGYRPYIRAWMAAIEREAV